MATETRQTVVKPTVGEAGQPPAPRRLSLNFMILSGGEAIVKLLTFAAFFWIARVLGPQRYGSVEFAVAVMAFFTLFTDFGIGDYGAREIARHRLGGAAILHQLVALRFLLSFASMAALAVVVVVIDKPPAVKLLLAFYGLSLAGYPLLLNWFFQGRDRMTWVTAAHLIRQAMFAALVLLFFRASTSLAAVGVFECIAVAATGLFCAMLVRARFGFAVVSRSLSLSSLRRRLAEAFPIGFSQICWALLWYFATVFLGFVTADRSLGWYGASHRAMMSVHTFVWLYFFNLLPSISRCRDLPREHLVRLLGSSLRVAAWAGLFAAFMLSALSGELMVLAYGPRFAGGATLFGILVWMVPVAMLSGHYRYTLIGYNLQRWLSWCALISATAAVGLSFLLIPRYGAAGAASTLLTANVIDFGLSYWCVRRFVGRIRFSAHLIRPGIALAASVCCFLFLKTKGAWTATLAAGVVYLALLICWEHRRLRRLAVLLLGRQEAAA